MPITEKYTPAHPYKLQTAAGDDSTAVTVLATDDGFERFLTGDQPPALRAAHLDRARGRGGASRLSRGHHRPTRSSSVAAAYPCARIA